MTERINNPIIPMMRLGNSDSPFPNLKETHVVTSGKVVLAELPDEFTGVKVTGDNKTWYEVKEIDEQLEANDYIVDYRNKLITFNIANNGKQLLFEYKGTGVLYYPTTMIYTKFSDGEVLQTLDELTDELYTEKERITKVVDDAVAATTGVVEKANYAQQQGDFAKTEASNLSTLKTNVTTATTNANNAVSTINGKITEATTAITNTNSAVTNLNHLGEYSASTKYFPRNIVSYNGSSYMNIAESTGALPTDTTKWKPTSIKGDKGDKGEIGSVGGLWQGAYNATKTYDKGTLTSYNGRVYIALQNSTGNLPTNTTFWELFSEKGIDGSGNVDSVNGKNGDIVLSADEVGAIPASQKGVANGVAGINADGKVVDGNGGVFDLFTTAEKTKLSGIATGANNYSHPSTHPASIITQDTNNRFSTDVEKAKWNSAEGNAKTYADSLVVNLGSTMNKEIYRDIARLNLELAASKMVTSGSTFGVDGTGANFGLNVDMFRAKSTAALSVGATTITLDTVTGLTVGMEVTIFDDVNLERKVITAINTSTKVITVSALTKVFKAQVNVARSMHIVDTVKQALVFGGWENAQTISKNDTVLALGNKTSVITAKPLMLDNGWLVAMLFDSAGDYYFMVSKDNGENWAQLTFLDFSASLLNNGTMIADGNIIVAAFPNATAINIKFFDVTTVTNTNLSLVASGTHVETGQNGVGAVAMAKDIPNNVLHVVWVSMHPSYPNAFNLRYANSPSNGATWTTPDQITVVNTAGADYKNPSMVLRKGKPVVVFEYNSGTAYGIGRAVMVGNGWNLVSNGVVTNNTSHLQASPSLALDKTDDTLAVAWQGVDAIHSVYYIRFARSIDGGFNWTTMQKLVVGTNANLSISANGKYHIVYEDTGVIKRIESSDKGATWSTAIMVGTGTVPSTLVDQSLDFTVPLTLRKNGANGVLFKGDWNKKSMTSILENDIRFTTADAKEVVAWVEHDSNLVVDATVNATVMTKTAVNANEDRLLGTLASKLPVTVNVKLKRATTTADDKVTKIIGGIG